MGETSVGKDFILNRLVDKYKMKKIVTYTTRPMRVGEQNGVNYHYISENEFKAKIDRGELLEYTVYETVFGVWWYGTSKESLNEDNTVIILDANGVRKYNKYTNHGAIVIFIKAESELERIYHSLIRMNDNGNIETRHLEELYRRVKDDKKKMGDIETSNEVDYILKQKYNSLTLADLHDIILLG